MSAKTFHPIKLVAITALLLIISCGKGVKEIPEINPEFGKYISAFTSGIISKKSTIVVQLTTDYYNPVKKGDKASSKLFHFNPSIDGTAKWIDQRTIEFTPEENLESDKVYNGEFRLAKLLDVPDEFAEFKFQFKTIKQDLKVQFDGMRSYDENKPEKQKLSGKVYTADDADATEVQRVLFASQNGNTLDITWEHTAARTHVFTIENIARTEKKGSVFIKWNGKFIDSKTKDEESFEIPALGDFKIINTQVVQSPEQYLILYFSDPLQKVQNLEGLIRIGTLTNLSYNIEGNKLTIYPSSRLSGRLTVAISEGLKNIFGYKTTSGEEIEVAFEQIKPNFRMVGKGVILPNSQGLIFPFEAVNLSAIDITFIKIYEDNIVHFLQDNHQIDGTYQLHRVAENIGTKTVHLDGFSNYQKSDWKRYHVDLSDYINVDPGAIYMVQLTAKKSYSLYACEGEDIDDNLTTLEFEQEQDWHQLYDYQLGRRSRYYYSYSRNPCEEGYYSMIQSRNILASDLGVISKIGEDKKVHVVVNNLLSTAPISGVDVEFYSYQNKLLGKTQTNSDGMVEMELRQKPFLVVAKHGRQRGYLKLDDGNSLSLSKFDVAGARTQKGLKGYIYGERGVWRPGDSIYVSFVLEDKLKTLPASHPIRFELINPRGQVVQNIIKTQGVNGVYDFRTATDPDAPTGNWNARVSVGNTQFYEKIKVETVKPNRLKIYLDFDKKVITNTADTKGKLAVKWLHGAIAKNLRVKVDVSLVAMHTSFEGFKGYAFDSPLKSFAAEETTAFDNKIDHNGEATFTPDIKVSDAAPGMLRAYFNTRAFEESGNFSVDRFSTKYSPYKSYVGIKMPTGNGYYGSLALGENHKVEVASVDAQGKPINRNNLEVKVYHVQWRWWWDRYDRDLASYISSQSVLPVQKGTVSTANGKGAFTLSEDIEQSGRYIAIITDPISGHSTGKIFYMWNHNSRYTSNIAQDPTMLVFSCDKDKYSVGDKASINFPSSKEGRALVCIETGTKILKKLWVDTKSGNTKVEIPITEEMAPNVFVHVSLLQPHHITENDLPIRMYGVIPMMVENPETHLKPVLAMADVLKPEETTTIKVSEATGKPMTYTLAIVDEGLLDLTRFKTPDPWPQFYAREALGVKTWDMYDLVMGAYGGELDRILSLGGDGSNGKGKPTKANRFKPMVKFIGPFALERGKTASHQIDIPNYIGSVRVMVVASQDGAYGNTEKTVPVRKPLMVLGTLPRVLGPTETVMLPVNVFAMEKHVKNVQVEVKTNGMFTVRGSKTKEVQFAKPGDEVVTFELEVANKIGIGKVEILTKSGSETARHEIELDVRASNPIMTDVVEAIIQPGDTWTSDYAFAGIEGTNEGTLELSGLPPFDLERRMGYLIRYPHGCIEQTTSSVLPQLFVKNIIELDNENLNKIDKHIKAGLDRLKLFQTAQGGFSYWPGQPDDSDWGSNYAGHFILEAEKSGYRLPSGMKKRWIAYQKKEARNWRDHHRNIDYDPHRSYYRDDAYYYDLGQAYRLYTLALAGEPELGAMNRLRESSTLSVPGKWRLAAAYQMIGQNDVAKQMVSKLTTEVQPYTELSYSYGSDIRDRAMILETLTLLSDFESSTGVVKDISSTMSDEHHWMSTQETAYCLLSMSKYLGKISTSNVMNFAYTIGDRNPARKQTSIPVFQEKLSAKESSGKGKVSVTNNGNGVLYAKFTMEGIPVAGEEKGAEKNLGIKVKYLTIKGETLDPAKIEQGTDFVAEVTLHNPGIKGNYKEMALSQIFPSGWEIRNTRMEEFSAFKTGNSDYQDIRDDRIYTYYGLSKNQSVTYRVMLNASYVGHFYMPGVVSDAMYDNTIYARVPGKWVDVVEPGVLVNK